VFAPKCGIDNDPATIYFAARRRLKGLAQKFSQTEVGWVIRSTGQPGERPDPKKPMDSARSRWGLELAKAVITSRAVMVRVSTSLAPSQGVGG